MPVMPDAVAVLMQEMRRYMENGEAPAAVQTGTVTSTEPMTVSCGHMTLTQEDLRINPVCLYDPPKGDPPNPAYVSAGDQVLMVTPDGQTYYLICKVV